MALLSCSDRGPADTALLARPRLEGGRCSQQKANLISLNILAFDNHGQPVGDLSSDDFQVTDQGKVQPIVAFRKSGETPQLSLKPGESRSSVPAVTVILFDLLNANIASRTYAEDEIVHSLEHLETSDAVYLYLLTNAGSLYTVHPMPDHTTDLGEAATPWTQQIRPLLKTAIDNVYGLRPMDEQQVSARVDTTYRAIELLTSKLGPFPGHKNLIWVTHGVPTNVHLPNGEWYDYSSRLHELATALDHDDIALTTVDRNDNPGSRDISAIQEFADLTGGKLYDSDLEKAIGEVMLDSRFMYVIQYAATPPDGKYHKIRVTCTRKGIRIQTKQGYYSTR